MCCGGPLRASALRSKRSTLPFRHSQRDSKVAPAPALRLAASLVGAATGVPPHPMKPTGGLLPRLFCVLAGVCVGAFAPAAPEPKVEMSVQLPPFIIEQPAGPKWRYTRIPRFEILSRCHDLTTGQLTHAFHRANQLLGLVLPERFQLALDVPQILIFYDEKLWPVAEQQAVAAMLRTHPPARPDADPAPAAPPRARLEPATGARFLGLGSAPAKGAGTTSFFSNLMLSDADVIVTFALVSDSTIDPRRSYLTGAYVGNLLQSRAPALPDWFTAGFMRLYDRMEFADNTVTIKPRSWDASAVSAPPAPDSTGRDEPTDLTRIASRQDTRPLKARRALELGQQTMTPPQANPGDLSRRDALAATPPAPAPDPELRLPLAGLIGAAAPDGDLGPWLEQAELVVAWGLDPANGRADAFWMWLDRTATEPATETLFQACLGLDYAAATRSLIAYAARPRGLRWVLSEALTLPPAEPLEDATPRQIARLKGEWERLEARYVRKNLPDLEAHYVSLARRTFRRAYDRDDRDPRLLASLGLLELDAGNKTEAAPLLAGAVQAGVVRPRAYFELARLRYDALVGRSTRNDGKFPADQIEPVVQALLAGMKQSPPFPAAYELLAHVAQQSIEPPSNEVLYSLEAGACLFSKKRDRLLELSIGSVNNPP